MSRHSLSVALACMVSTGCLAAGCSSEKASPATTHPPVASSSTTSASESSTSSSTPTASSTPTPTSTVVRTPPTEPPTEPATTSVAVAGTAPVQFDLGSAKQPRPYDAAVKAEMNDIVAFWTTEFPKLSSSPYKPLAGKVYPGYPGRTDIPACGGSATIDYATELQDNAFYCPSADYVAYDDESLFPAVYGKLGAVSLGVILAHEIGHDVQTQAGVPSNTATIVLEQQADCYAGTWINHLLHENNPKLPFAESDIKNALLALLSFKDPIGTTPAAPGAHGSGFDRVGAFEDGFTNGVVKCATYIDQLPPILELPVDQSFFVNNGNAPLDNPDKPVLPDPNSPTASAGIFGLLITDLPRFWQAQLSTQNIAFTPPHVTGYDSSGRLPRCTDAAGDFANDPAVYCHADNTIYVNRTLTTALYKQIGDFAVGYAVASAYGDDVQIALGSKLTHAKRALLDDCLAGAYTQSTIPTASSQQNQVTVQAGDLDEAVKAAVTIGDATTTADKLGTGFEKVGAFRLGVLGGSDACKPLLNGG